MINPFFRNETSDECAARLNEILYSYGINKHVKYYGLHDTNLLIFGNNKCKILDRRKTLM